MRTDRAARDIRKKKTEYISDAAQRQKIGQIEDAQQSAEYQDVLQQEADLTAGHGAGTDPLERFRQRLLADGIADEAFFAAALAAAQAEEEQIRTAIEALGSRPGTEMFDLVFQETTPALQAQAANWREESEHV